MWPTLHNSSVLVLDTETTGLRYKKDSPFGVAVAWDDGYLYEDLREGNGLAFIGWLKDQIAETKCPIVFHNAFFDVRMLEQAGIAVPFERVRDTLTREVLINEHRDSYSLDEISKSRLGKQKVDTIYEELARAFGGRPTRNVQAPNMHRAPSTLIRPYAERDVELTRDLYLSQEQEIRGSELHDIVGFEQQVFPSIMRAGLRGIRVDLNLAEKHLEELNILVSSLLSEFDGLVGRKINVDSADEVAQLLGLKKTSDREWTARDGTTVYSTKTGKPNLDANAFRRMTDPLASIIQRLRSLVKTRDVFIGKYILDWSSGGRIYPFINQNRGEYGGTQTGRLSYTDPAVQQIPSRDEDQARWVKPLFLPEEGHTWVDTDMHSFEVRVFAHLVNNPEILAAYDKDPGLDLHQYVADITGLPRSAPYGGAPNAKQLNLASIFNAGKGKTAEMMGFQCTPASFEKGGRTIHYKKAPPEAERIIEEYHQKIPGIQTLASRAQARAQERGYVFTFRGRRLRFPDRQYAYKASGLLIQATAADINKENWVLIDDYFQASGHGHMVLNTHDSYSLSVEKGREDQIFKDIKELVENRLRGNATRMRVPLLLELNGVGDNWWGALSND